MVKNWFLALLFYLHKLSDAHAPNICEDATIDTIVQVKDGSTYAFKGNYYWKILSHGGIARGYPRKICDDWSGLEGNLDASFSTIDHQIYFFKGYRYWKFNNTDKVLGPVHLSIGFNDMPMDIDAAFLWDENEETYFFKGDYYWSFNSSNSYPITAWSSELAGGIDAALRWKDQLFNRIYFFKGDKYYRYVDKTKEIHIANPPYPRSTAKFWFYCP